MVRTSDAHHPSAGLAANHKHATARIGEGGHIGPQLDRTLGVIAKRPQDLALGRTAEAHRINRPLFLVALRHPDAVKLLGRKQSFEGVETMIGQQQLDIAVADTVLMQHLGITVGEAAQTVGIAALDAEHPPFVVLSFPIVKTRRGELLVVGIKIDKLERVQVQALRNGDA